MVSPVSFALWTVCQIYSTLTGNLIRTLDGKLAILDFGLMTQITENQKFGMIEAISHLVHRDYQGIGDDFKRLDFIPEEVPHSVDGVMLLSVFLRGIP